MRKIQLLASSALVSLALPIARPAIAAEAADVATSVLELGGSMGKLVWTEVKNNNVTTQSQANRYQAVATQIQKEIEVSRAASGVAQGTLGVVGTTLLYAAIVDPEPLSKGIAGVAAWGAKKAGDAMGQMVLDQSQERARSTLADLFKSNGLNPQDLKSLDSTQLEDKVADLKAGGTTLRDALDPDSLQMLQDNAVDIATDIGVEAFTRATDAQRGVAEVKADVDKMRGDIESYQENVQSHIDDVTGRLQSLQGATELAARSLSDLNAAVGANSTAIRTLSEVSYSGWTTAQKLQAVQGGLFPDLGDTKGALIKSLEADQAREKAISDVQLAAQDLGNIASIAKNIGLPPDAVKGLQGAQILASGVAQFATGNYLGAVASVTSLVGLNAPDAAADRQKAMMQYLQQRFFEINEKLNKIIDLQVQTFKALQALSEQQVQFRKEVLGQLDRIEDTIIRDGTLLRNLVLDQWSDCPTIINDPAVLNGSYSISSKEALKKLISHPNMGKLLYDCVHGKGELISLLSNNVKAANWSGTMLAAETFPNVIVPGSSIQKSLDAFEFQRDNAFNSAKDFIMSRLSATERPPSSFPARYLARFAQPVVDVEHSRALAKTLADTDATQKLDNFHCDQKDVLSRPLVEIMCYGVAEGSATPPHVGRFDEILRAPLIGPLGMTVLDTGMVVAKLLMFGKLNPGFAFEMVPTTDIDRLSDEGMSSELRAAFEERDGGERKDVALLNRLSWLAEATALQQSIAYGNYTAELVEQSLYDPKTRAIDTDPRTLSNEQLKALEAMRANPVLARNVVMLAMRHAVADALGGADLAQAKLYRQTYYGLALADFEVPASCSVDASDTDKVAAKQKINELFPNWIFEYVVTAAQAADPKHGELKICPQQFAQKGDKPLPDRGTGVAVSLGTDFYVLAPTPMQLASGAYELNDSLRLALAYRDRVNQAIIDQNLGKAVRDTVSQQGEVTDVGKVALGILNQGWDWQTRRKSSDEK